MKLLGAIFDLDGTLVDSRRQWNKAFVDTIKELGGHTSDPEPEAHGVPIEENWKILIRKYKIKTDKTLEEIKDLTYKNYVKYLSEVRLNPGVMEFLEYLKDESIKMALATNSEWRVVEKIFDNLGLNNFFDATVTGEETPNMKPDPDCFLIAADKLGFEPGDCLVVGDTDVDVEAAKSAGMKIIGVAFTEEEEKKLRKANFVAEGFSEITPETIDRL